MSTFTQDEVLSQEFSERVASTQRRLAHHLTSEYDYIICGAGTSGSVLAYRLCENPNIRMLLLEAGGSDESEMIKDPNQWVMTLGGPSDWSFVATSNPRLNGRAVTYSMGKGLGGGSSINVSTWSRGHKDDWDFFASETGDASWGYNSILALYRTRIENWAGEPDALRGQGGMVHVQPAPDLHPFAETILLGAESVRLPRFPNQNGSLMEFSEGCSVVDETVLNGKRRSIFRSYAYQAMAQGNLTVLTDALVRKIVFEGTKARLDQANRFRTRNAGGDQCKLSERSTGHEGSRRRNQPRTRDRQLLGTASLRQTRGKSRFDRRRRIRKLLRNGLVTFWRQSCTAKMGRDANSVVDCRLRVHGIECLRIADASVLPRVTRGNTMAPCVVVGEKAADFIRQDNGHTS